MTVLRRAAGIGLVLALAACAGGGHEDSPTYRAGFGDGCTTASAPSSGVTREPQRDDALSSADPDYRAGWSSGYAACRTNAPGARFGSP
jgi:hypothetical protein